MLDEFDALAAAPGYHRLAFEDDEVRVLETRIEPGHTVPMHTHVWPSVNYALAVSDFVRRDENGLVTMDSRLTGIPFKPGDSYRAAPFPMHTLENVGHSAIHVITVEFKSGSS